MKAIRATTASGVVTPDLGGTASTTEVGDAILSHLQ
jgi:isocitrate/isopropylmalate dehydrogenase